MTSFFHPGTMKVNVETAIPSQRANETFGKYILHIQEYLRREEYRGRRHSYGEKVSLIMQNLRTKYSEVFIPQLETLHPNYKNWTMNDNIPFDFQEH